MIGSIRLASSRPRERGLSLIEVMIAIALLSFALITLISKVHGCMDTAKVSEYENAAREFAKEVLAEIEAGTIDGLFDGTSGDFSDRGYPELRYAIGFGDSSQVSNNGTSNNDPNARENGFYRKETSATQLPDEESRNTADPSSNSENADPYTRVKVAVQFPLPDDKTGLLVLEKMIPTECTKGARGLEEKKQKDAEKAEAEGQREANQRTGGGGETRDESKGGGGGKPGGGKSGGGKPPAGSSGALPMFGGSK